MKLEAEHIAAMRARQAERLAERAISRNPVLVIAAVAALVTMVFVPPSPEYASYFDWHTLTCLFCILCVLAAIDTCGLLEYISHSIAERAHSTRMLIIALVVVSFVCSMFLSNDMALVTVLPLASMLLKSVHREREIPFTFVMVTLAANSGGMLLPFGNPHNLYLCSIFNVSFSDFAATMAPPFVVSFAFVLVCCAFVHTEPFSYKKPDDVRLSKSRAVLFLALFGVCIAMSVNAIPYAYGAVFVILMLALTDHEAFSKADYQLILTFVCFFVFSGNIARIPAIATFLSGLVQAGTFVVTLVSSQVISNVPSAILMAHFSTDWAGIAIGSNIGGIGTPIASLASLITLRQFQKGGYGGMGRFLAKFEAYSFAFLVLVTLFEIFVMHVW